MNQLLYQHEITSSKGQLALEMRVERVDNASDEGQPLSPRGHMVFMCLQNLLTRANQQLSI